MDLIAEGWALTELLDIEGDLHDGESLELRAYTDRNLSDAEVADITQALMGPGILDVTDVRYDFRILVIRFKNTGNTLEVLSQLGTMVPAVAWQLFRNETLPREWLIAGGVGIGVAGLVMMKKQKRGKRNGNDS